MRLKNLSTDRGAKLIPLNNQEYTFDYGLIQKNTNGDLFLRVYSEEDISDIELKVSCGGCTKASKERINDNEFRVTINYKTSIVGTINKKVYLFPKLKNKKQPEQKITIHLKGEVQK